MDITEYVVEGTSYDRDEWIKFWGGIRQGPLKNMYTLKLGTYFYKSRECYFSWDRSIGKDGKEYYTISDVDPRNEKERRLNPKSKEFE